MAKDGSITQDQYLTAYQESVADPAGFWEKQAAHYLDWDQKWQRVFSGDFTKADVTWFDGAKLNVCYNCVDRHLPERADQTALIVERDEPGNVEMLNYGELHKKVCQVANVLKQHGVQKGDRVCLYLPMSTYAVIAMLACARIGAVHSVVFAGFSPQALKGRIADAQCRVVITADATQRGGKVIPLKNNVDVALLDYDGVEHVMVVQHAAEPVDWHEGRDRWLHELMAQVDADCPCESMDAEDPLFILYTSGSTGKPKGVVHSGAGYLLYVTMTFKLTFDYRDGDIYWCSADVGWITGHSYVTYGPLANGVTQVIFEGVPTYPTVSRYWQIIDEYKVNIFYTAPTAIRALMREGDEAVLCTSRDSLRILGTVGEPINPEVWQWYHDVVGDGRCPIMDTWWQTETGGFMLTPLPTGKKQKPGAASQPFFGVEPVLLDANGKECQGVAEGFLAFKQPWPAVLRDVFGDHQRYLDTYFSIPGYYLSGDAARRDEQGDYWIVGRTDDVINVSGHRLGTAEIESAILECNSVAEAAVVGMAHDVKGTCIYAFITPKSNVDVDAQLDEKVREVVKAQIGSIAKPDYIQWTADLPKTRSGKIMRRILRKIVNQQFDELGDTSTLANPEVVQELITDYKNSKQ